MTKKDTCFVIAPIGLEGSETRRRSDRVFEEILKPAIRKCGYAALHARSVAGLGFITTEIVRHIVSDSLVIADLTDGNPNVFYELGLRHAVGKPVVQIVAKGQQIPFSVMGARTVSFDIDDIDNVRQAIAEIVKQIRMIERDVSPLETPVSEAGFDRWTPIADVETSPTADEVTSIVVRRPNQVLKELDALATSEAIPLLWNYIEDLQKNPRVHLLGRPIDDLNAACQLVNNVPEGGFISATSSLQGEDSDEFEVYRTSVNLALERNVNFRKIICSSPELSPERRRKWLEEFTDKAELIRKGRIRPDAFQLLHYPMPMSVDVQISQDEDGECREMVAGYSGGGGQHGGFRTDDKRMVSEWLGIYVEGKVITEAEYHTSAVWQDAVMCSCLEFLTLLEEARKQAPQPKTSLRNVRRRIKLKPAKR